jgi:cytochrome c oxidase subunit II
VGDKRRNPAVRLAGLAGLATLVMLTVSGCSAGDVMRFGWPEGVTPQADRMREFWTWSVVASLIVGVIVWGLILWPVLAHRKRGDTLPRQFQYNHFLEFIYTGIPSIIVVVLFYFTVVTQDYVLAEEPDDKVDVKVNVLAFQWNWQFEYEHYKDPTGATVAPRTPEGPLVTTVGSSTEIPLLVLPTQNTIHYQLRARDVIHSFYVPEFNFKRDVFPYPEKNDQVDSFQNTIDREGSFKGYCAELCGTYHSGMAFEVRALNEDRFDRFMDLRRTVNEETGKPYTAAEALGRLGEEDASCAELCNPVANTTSPFNTDRRARTSSGE